MGAHDIIWFVLLPMLTGVVCVLAHRQRSFQIALGLLALLCNLGLAVAGLLATLGGEETRILVSQMGNWPAPFGISVVLDPLAAIMLAVEAVTVLAVYIYCIGHLPQRFAGGYFHALYHFLVFGVQWSLLTGDLFNLFVAFEIMLMASYAMFCVGGTRAQMRHAYKYVLLNLFASTLFVTACGLIYGQMGTLNLADLARLTGEGALQERPTTVLLVALLLVVFGGKSAIFPLWFWLPDAYPTLPAALGGLFAGLLTKVGAYVMVRVFVMVFGAEPLVGDGVGPLLAISAGVTMFLGVLGAVSMHTVRRILSIHIISQVGYMVMGVALGAAAGLSMSIREIAVAGAIFFIVHNMVVKCSLFLCGGLMQAHAGSDDLEKIGGLAKRAPWLGVLLFIAAMSLAGLPPLSGFFGKFLLIQAGFLAGGEGGAGWYWLTGFAIATSLLTLLSMLKIWGYAFWSPARGDHADRPEGPRPALAPGMTAVVLLVLVALSMGPFAQPWLSASRRAAAIVVSPQPYITAVLAPRTGGEPTWRPGPQPPPRDAQPVAPADPPDIAAAAPTPTSPAMEATP